MSAVAKAFPPDSPERVASALSYLDAGDRDLWVRMAFATKDALGEDGRDAWMNWSRTADNFHQAAAGAVWKSAKAGGKTGAASLFYLARQAGWKDDSKPVAVDPVEQERRSAERTARDEQAAADKANAQAAAAERAQAIFEAGQTVIGAVKHGYLERKGVKAHGGLRIGDWPVIDFDTGEIVRTVSGALLIPIRDRTGKLWSLQAIFDGKVLFGRDKDYLAGGAKAGHFFAIGKPQEQEGRKVYVLAEGYATAASLHECTGHCVLVSFDAGNLLTVAASIRERQPDAIIVIAADNDQFTKRRDGTPYNPGVEAATEAARVVGGCLAVPQFASLDGQPSDFNDLRQREGSAPVIEQIFAALKAGPVAAEEEPAVPERPAEAEGAGTVRTQVRAAAPASSRNKGERKQPEFGAPIDLFNVSLPPQVPLSVLPDLIAAYAKDQAGLLGCDHSIIGMAALVAAAACITDGIKLQPKRMDPTWTESARLWVGVVGDPSTKKSPSISKAVRHVKRLEARLAEENHSAYGDWKYRHEQWKVEKKAAKGQDVSPEPEQPPMKRLIVEDTTVEALSEVLKDNERGVLCLQDELTGWFASMDAYKGGGGKGANKDRAHWLEIYNGGRRSIDRVTRGSLVVPNWSACMIGGIQPEMMRRIANGMGNDGLLQRFMIVVARPAQKGEDRYPDRDAMDRFGALFDHLEGLSPSEQPVTMTEAAHQARERIEAFAEKMIKAFDHPHIQAWLGKWEGLFARLTLTYHVIECAEESIYPDQKQVRGEIAEKVERLMCGTLLHHAIHFYSEIVDANDRYSNMRQLARLVLARGMAVVTKRDLHNYWRASRKLQPWEVKNIIDNLCNMDWFCPDETSIDATDGKPKAWFVNPAVHEVFADYAVRERARREEAVEALREIKRAYDDAGSAGMRDQSNERHAAPSARLQPVITDDHPL